MGNGVPEVLTNFGAVQITLTAETSFDMEDVCVFQVCDEVCAVELCRVTKGLGNEPNNIEVTF